jgi:hypothetical protein
MKFKGLRHGENIPTLLTQNLYIDPEKVNTFLGPTKSSIWIMETGFAKESLFPRRNSYVLIDRFEMFKSSRCDPIALRIFKCWY